MAHPVTWFEIIGPDARAIQTFYREVFGWKMTAPTGEEMGYYSMLEDHEPGIGGGLGQGGSARVSIYIESADPQRVLDKAVANGATVLMPITTITPGTTIGMFSDPAGNTVGILKANPRAKAASAPAKKPASRGRTTAAKKTAAKKTTARKTAAKRTAAKRTKRR